MEYSLVVKEVTKELGTKTILNDISFSVKKGEIFGIIGMSGSGKTTILHHLIGFLEPDKGQILYAPRKGADLKSLSNDFVAARKMFGFSPQRPSFYPQLTVDENLSYFGGLYRLSKKQIKENADRYLDITELSNHRTKLASELSGGMQRRLSIACSLMHDPSVLILDEPTSDLDPVLREQMWNLIREINTSGTTIVVASHFLEELERVSSTIAILQNGKIIKQGDMHSLRKAFIDGTQEITITVHSNKEAKSIATMVKRSATKVEVRDQKVIIQTKRPYALMTRLTGLAQRGKIKASGLDLHDPTLREVFYEVAKNR